MNRFARMLLSVIILAGCDIRQISFSENGGNGGSSAGSGGSNTGGTSGHSGLRDGGADSKVDAYLPDALPDGCLPFPEVCNGRDDNCNGMVDEGYDLQTDTNNCGSCNNHCLFTNATATCVAGQCQLGTCAFGYGDADHDPANGCECLQTNGGVEICDGIDNDCNGVIDDNFDLSNDSNNCGSCGHRCGFQNAIGACRSGQCVLDRCIDNFYNYDSDASNGCEYGCIRTTNPAEICDGLDNDCDGRIDNNTIDEGEVCFPFGTGCNLAVSPPTCTGACQVGHATCRSGFLACLGYVGPSAEVCDNVDNDCNGMVDEVFNKQSDPLHCGTNCTVCDFPHAVESCSSGVCGIAACQTDYWNLNGNIADGCEYNCHRTGPEVCDGIDNDCDGVADNGFNKQTDPNNCGTACLTCSYAHAAALCQSGACAMGGCDPGWFNRNGNNADGCEYQCTFTSSTETCNGVDDNCNGQIDEGFDLQNDRTNCGTCGHICSFSHAAAACNSGVCVMGACDPGFINSDGQSSNGCEYPCTITNNGVEICDGLDNNCNHQVDESDARIGTACNPAEPDQSRWNISPCRAGTLQCTNGNLLCQNYVGPSSEVCDTQDNDCNGMIDEGFNLQTDPNNCGSCGHSCAAIPHGTHAIVGCQAGQCAIVSCDAGFYNTNGVYSDGCEYACPNGSPGNQEVCDGIDNDCDGLIDSADAHPCTTAANCPQAAFGETCNAGKCSLDLQPITNFCATLGACAGSMPVCTTGQWVCNYGSDVQTTGPNQLVGNETRCDGKDNDCDGCIDETFPQVGLQPDPVGGTCGATTAQNCTDSGIGACQGHGHYVCNGTHDGFTCMITQAGMMSSAEVCDGVDNNCDGIVDNATGANRIIEPMVAISGGTLSSTVYVYQYEAARPDAMAGNAGTITTRACAKANVVPWTNLTYPQAAAACAAAGKRLCTEAEWQRACETNAGTPCTWSFASSCGTQSTTTCNTKEYDTIPGGSNDDTLLATGSLSNCYASWGAAANLHIFDLTGNAKEWAQARSAGVNPLRGGSYNNVLDGSTCGFNFTVADDSFQFPNVGFRCCSDSAP